MDIGVIKIILQIVAQFNLSDHVFLPVNKKLSALTPYDLMKDSKLDALMNNPALDSKMRDLEVLGIAIPWHSKKFLGWKEGYNVIQYLIENSTAKGTVDLDYLIVNSYGDVKGTGYGDGE